MAEIVIEKREESLLVTGFHVAPLQDSLKNINRFTLKKRPIADYVAFAIAIFNPVFMLVTAALCARTPIPKRKWLWIVFILLGFVQVTVNWTTGAMSVAPISFELLGTAFSRSSDYGPLLLSVSAPIGAIVFLIRRHRWIQRADLSSNFPAT